MQNVARHPRQVRPIKVLVGKNERLARLGFSKPAYYAAFQISEGVC